MNWQTRLASLADTDRLAERIALHVDVPMTIALSGALGAGKTQFVRSLAQHLGVASDLVTSPTYVLVQRYRGKLTIYHLDFYRLQSVDQVWDLGIDEWLVEPALTLIEWADKFPQVLPEDTLRCDLAVQPDGARIASLAATGPRSAALLQQVASSHDSEGASSSSRDSDGMGSSSRDSEGMQ
jgi:tRNA threonylcarbamoyladenosine biosynthesis protein TsaE